MRQYLRCREELSSGLLHILLYVAFVVTLVLFTRALVHMFAAHGADLNPWFNRGAVIIMGLFILSVLRRLYYKVLDLRETRVEMGRLKEEFQNQDR